MCDLSRFLLEPVFPEAHSKPRHDLERIGHVQNIGFSAAPAAIWIEADSAPFADETPAHYVWFFAMAAGCEPFRMPWGRAGLADLIEVGEERQNRDAFAALIDERFRTAQRCPGAAQKFTNQLARLRSMNLPVGLLLGPARAGNEQELCIGPYGSRSAAASSPPAVSPCCGKRVPMTVVRNAGSSTSIRSICAGAVSPA